jgi:hypothetical protein
MEQALTEAENNLSDEVSRLNEDCEHSSKGHFAAAEIWGYVHFIIGLPATALAAVAGLQAFKNHADLAGALAIFSAAISAVLIFLDPAAKKQSHLAAANQYNNLHKKGRLLCNVKMKVTEFEESLSVFEKLAHERDQLNLTSPQIPNIAYKIGRRRIKSGQTLYRVDSDS